MPVRRADQPHDSDLLAAVEHGQPNGIPDQGGRRHQHDDRDHDHPDAEHARDREQPIQQRPLVDDPVDPGLALKLDRDHLELLGVLQPHPERRRQRVLGDVLHQGLLVREDPLEALERLLLRLVVHAGDLRHLRQDLVEVVELRGADVVAEEHGDLDVRLGSRHQKVHLAPHQDCPAEQEQRDERRGHGGERHQAVALQAHQSLFEVVVEATRHSRTRLAPGLAPTGRRPVRPPGGASRRRWRCRGWP